MSLVLATTSASLSDVIDGGVPRTMGRTLGETLFLSAHIPTASEGSLVKTFKDVEAFRVLPWQRELRNSPDLHTNAHVKTARVVLEGATGRI